MRLGIVAFAIGCWLCQHFTSLPNKHWAWLLCLALPLMFCRSSWIKLPAGMTAGCLWALVIAHSILDVSLPIEWEGRDVQLLGTVASLPDWQQDSQRFNFKVDSLTVGRQTHSWPTTVRLSWYHGAPELTPGDRWRLTVRLKQPHGMRNAGGFDFEGWLFQQGIRATGYVRNNAEQHFVDAKGYSAYLHRIREEIRRQLLISFPEDSPFKGVLLALGLGDRSAISQAQWDVFMSTGTNHLMAISGLHIGLIAGMAFFLVGRLWGRVSYLCLRLPAPKAAAIAAILAATLYAALAGFSIPTQRAWVMTTAAMLALIWYRPLAVSQILCLALLAVLVWDPLAVMSPGFYLSFAAVAVITFVLAHRLRPYPWWSQWGRMQWAVSLALIPVVMLFFQQASLISPLANLLAVPWVGWLVVPLVLLAGGICLLLPTLASWLLAAASLLMDGLWWFLQGLASWEHSVWQHSVAQTWVLATALIGVALLLAPRGVPARWAGALWLVPLLWVKPAAPEPGEAWFSLLDVNQGLAAVVLTADHTLVFDAGPRFGGGLDMGDAVVAPFLRANGVERIDTLLISHGDNDHIGGASALLHQFPVLRTLTSVPEKIPVGKVDVCKAGQQWQWDGVRFEILHPDAESLEGGGNDASCVLRVFTGESSVLLTGDIERPAERVLLSRPDLLASDIVVVPHHGSRTSSTSSFIKAVDPQYALFPVGYRNRYGFPKADVVARYRAQNVQTLRTDRTGSVEFHLTPEEILGPKAYRWDNSAYWHHVFE